MIKYLTVIISDGPIAQREGVAGVIETRAIDLPDSTEDKVEAVMATLYDLSQAAMEREGII